MTIILPAHSILIPIITNNIPTNPADMAAAITGALDRLRLNKLKAATNGETTNKINITMLAMNNSLTSSYSQARPLVEISGPREKKNVGRSRSTPNPANATHAKTRGLDFCRRASLWGASSILNLRKAQAIQLFISAAESPPCKTSFRTYNNCRAHEILE